MAKTESTPAPEKMSFQPTWAMAVGGMIGGGIFSVLGVVVAIAGSLAWVSFLIGGVLALLTGISYARLADRYGEGGGAFMFLRKVHRESAAGSLSWVLLLGYVLTLSVYAFTFGHYLDAMFGLGAWFPRASGVAIVLFLVGINLRGVGDASWLELITVWGKLAVLVALAGFGIAAFRPERLVYADAEPGGFAGAVLGAATIFMAYEGFQLLSYDYDDIRTPKRVLPRAILASIVTVIAVYVAVGIGSACLVGAGVLVEKEEIALAVAGERAFGTVGLVCVSVAATFSTASAINATLFATARLTRDVAKDDELPRFLGHENSKGVPDRAVILLGVFGAALAAVGNLGDLVEAASLSFLFTFTAVNVIAATRGDRGVIVSWIGAAGTGVATIALAIRLALQAPAALGLLAAFALFAIVGRPLILRRMK